jgi:hypothetical protein
LSSASINALEYAENKETLEYLDCGESHKRKKSRNDLFDFNAGIESDTAEVRGWGLPPVF